LVLTLITKIQIVSKNVSKYHMAYYSIKVKLGIKHLILMSKVIPK